MRVNKKHQQKSVGTLEEKEMNFKKNRIAVEDLEFVTGGYRKARKIAEMLGQSPELAQ